MDVSQIFTEVRYSQIFTDVTIWITGTLTKAEMQLYARKKSLWKGQQEGGREYRSKRRSERGRESGGESEERQGGKGKRKVAGERVAGCFSV